MSELERKMILQATKRHKKIYPCSNRDELSACFTRHEDMIFFWYNTEDKSTHLLTAEFRDQDGVME